MRCFGRSRSGVEHRIAHAHCGTFRWSLPCEPHGFTHSLRLSRLAVTGALQMSVLERIDWRVSTLLFSFHSWLRFNPACIVFCVFFLTAGPAFVLLFIFYENRAALRVRFEISRHETSFSPKPNAVCLKAVLSCFYVLINILLPIINICYLFHFLLTDSVQ